MSEESDKYLEFLNKLTKCHEELTSEKQKNCNLELKLTQEKQQYAELEKRLQGKRNFAWCKKTRKPLS